MLICIKDCYPITYIGYGLIKEGTMVVRYHTNISTYGIALTFYNDSYPVDVKSYHYSKENFVTLEQWRNLQIDKIC